MKIFALFSLLAIGAFSVTSVHAARTKGSTVKVTTPPKLVVTAF